MRGEVIGHWLSISARSCKMAVMDARFAAIQVMDRASASQ